MTGKGEIIMSAKEVNRLRVMYRVKEKTLKLKDAAEILQLSTKQMGRIWKRFQSWGEAGLTHRGRGMPGNRRKKEEFRARVIGLYRDKYSDFGPTLAAEKMATLDRADVNRETLRRWLIYEGLWLGKRAHQQHRKKRPRKEHFGEMIQLDGSDHKWFEDRNERCCLMVMVDDATSRTQVYMSDKETTQSALVLLRKWIEKYGIPSSLYTDRKNIYITDRPPTREERRQGTGPLTDFGRVCMRLGIRIIPAGSPQAKGRIERKNGVLQDRLVKELRLKGIHDITKANEIMDEFIDDLNRRFCLRPEKEANYHRRLPLSPSLDDLLCLEHQRRLQKDWTFEYHGKIYQVEQPLQNLSPGKKLTIWKRIDGTFKAKYENSDVLFRKVGNK